MTPLSDFGGVFEWFSLCPPIGVLIIRGVPVMSKKSGNDVLLENRKARFLYFLSDFMTAGMVLTGTEIKSLRARNASLSESYVTIKN